MSDAIRIFGTKQIEAKFKAPPGKIRRKIMRKGMVDGSRIVRARESVLVANGTLRKSIKVMNYIQTTQTKNTGLRFLK